VFSAGDDRIIRVWDAARGSLLRVYPPDAPISALAYLPESETLVSTTSTGSVRLHALDGTNTRTLGGHAGQVMTVMPGVAGHFMTSDIEGDITEWDGSTGLRAALRGHTDRVPNLDVLPVEGLVASASFDGTIRVWRRPPGEKTLLVASDMVYHAHLTRDDRLVADGAAGFVTIRELATGKTRLLRHGGEVAQLAVSADEQQVASASWDGTVRLWETSSGKELFRGQHEGRCQSVAMSPDGQLLATGDSAGPVRLWDLTHRTEENIGSHRDGARQVVFSPDGEWLASGGHDGGARAVHLPDRRAVQLVGQRAPVNTLAFSPDGQLVAAGGLDGIVVVWDVRTGAAVLTGKHGTGVTGLAFGPRGGVLASASADRSARIWDLEAKTSIVLRHPHQVVAIAFSPDGRHLATGAGDRAVRLWGADGALVRIYRGHSQMVLSVAFVRDGKSILSTGVDGAVREWPVQTSRWQQPPDVLELQAITNAAIERQ
jgi:WD40 repeat protein